MEIVIGSTGFIGQHVVKQLLSEGKQVIPLSSEYLTRPKFLRRFFEKYQPFRIYNLAAYGNLHGQDDKYEIYNAIVYKLLNLLVAIDGLECFGFVTTGSTSEYGMKFEPMQEENILCPTSIYGAAKAAATHLAQTWAIRYNKPIVVLRPASVTGVGDHRIHLIPVLIRSCMSQEPIHFVGEPTHDYIDVQDIARAYSLLGQKAWEVKGQIFNVGNGKEWSNQEVLGMIEEITGKKANIIGVKNLTDYEKTGMWVADSTKIRKLGWEPTIPLRDSLERMIHAYRS